MRHGDAPEREDGTRPLSPEGIEQVLAIRRDLLVRCGIEIRSVYTSIALRAWQTALLLTGVASTAEEIRLENVSAARLKAARAGVKFVPNESRMILLRLGLRAPDITPVEGQQTSELEAFARKTDDLSVGFFRRYKKSMKYGEFLTKIQQEALARFQHFLLPLSERDVTAVVGHRGTLPALIEGILAPDNAAHDDFNPEVAEAVWTRITHGHFKIEELFPLADLD